MPRPLNVSNTAPYAVASIATAIGQRIRLARQRRRVKLRDLAARAGVAYETARAVERGSLATGIGAYLATAWALGLEREFATVLEPERDVEGLALERARTPMRVRTSRRNDLDNDF
jgi:transcriptional regulator with XRE-family HTH domain